MNTTQTTPQTRPFSLLALSSISPIVDAAQRGAKVRILMGDDPEFILEGTARSLGDENGNFATTEDDVRDLFLRVTSLTGFEHFIPVSELMVKVSEGAFAIDN